MKKTCTKILGIGLLAALAFGPALTLCAAEKEKKESKTKGTPYSGKVEAVDKTAKTITLGSKEKNRTYSITSDTKVTKMGKPATLDEAVVGEDASAYGHEESGKQVAQSLRLGPKEEGKSKEKKKKKGETE